MSKRPRFLRDFWSGSLKTRVTLVTLSVFLISIWTLSIYVSFALRKDIIDLLGQQQLSTAAIIATGINNELNSRFEALHGAAQDAAPLMSKPDILQADLERESILQMLFNGGIIITGPDGTAIADLPKTTGRIGVNYSGDEWVEAALREGRSMVGQPIMGKVLHAPIFPVTVPVFGPGRTVIGTVNGVVDLGRPNFLDSLAHSGYGKTGGFLLVSPKYRLIVTASDKQRIMQLLPPPGVNLAIDRALRGEEGTYVFVNPEGEKVLDAVKNIPASGWQIVVSLPTREAFSPIRGLQHRIFLAALLLTLLAGFFTWLTLRRQLAPLTAAVRTLGGGADTKHPLVALPVTSQDEVGELITAFNELLERLHKREEKLRERTAFLDKIIDSAALSMWISDEKGTAVRANPACFKLFGAAEHEVIGKYNLFKDLVIEEKGLLPVIHDVFEKGEVASIEMDYDFSATGHLEVAKGTHRVVNSIFTPILDNAGKVSNVIVQTIDLTEKKKAEEEKKKLESQIRQTQKMEAIGTLAGGIAHDFNNILAVIVGYVDMAREEVPTGSKLAEDLDMVFTAANRAKELVKQILAFSKQATIEQIPLHLQSLVKETLKALRSFIPATIEIQDDIDQECGVVFADPTQVHQILMNLCTNAYHAMETTGGILRVELRRAHLNNTMQRPTLNLKAGEYVELTVSDTGAGIAPSMIDKIFDPYFSTKETGKGTGLGLAIVHGIIASYGGGITVESELEKGTTFHVYFPVVVERELPHDQKVGETPHGNERILFIDDEKFLVEMGKDLLEQLGYSVTGKNSSSEALTEFQQHPQAYDLVITDQTMPGMTGENLARRMLQIRPDIPIILFTGYSNLIDEPAAKAIGIREFALKPMTKDTIAKLIRKVLDGESGTA